MDRKRRIDLSGDNGAGASFKKKSYNHNETELNPWTGAPYSARYYSILETRTKLPVYLFKDQLIETVHELHPTQSPNSASRADPTWLRATTFRR